MFDHKLFVRNAASWVGGFLLGGALPFAAMAQNPTDTLAGYITQQFGANGTYTQGKLGNDWCFNVDRELGYNWWYYDRNDTKGLVARQVANAIRIQATYVDPTDNSTKYASLLVGLDISNQNDLPMASTTLDALPLKVLNTAPKYALPAKREAKPMLADVTPPNTGPPPFASGSNPLQFPGSSNCMNLGAFLMAYALPLVPMMQSQPGLRAANWYQDKASFTQVYTDARYWMFKGRPHAVINIMGYVFGLQDNASTPNQYPNVFLVVGIGGGSGP
jgi:hypothetical protein